jgi:molecular chaperone DnaK (HSP70)
VSDRAAVGLDFGTTTTLLATGDSVVPLGKLRPWLPSLIGFDSDGSVLVGEEADAAEPGQTMRSVKRAITKRWNTIRDSALPWAGTAADELIVELLRTVCNEAWARDLDLSEPGTVAVGCPAVWDSGQRRRLVRLLNRAGVAAGVSDLVDEPIAAGIAWLVRQPSTRTPMRMLVFDMGGGTLDLAVIDIRGTDEHDVYLLAAVGRAEAGDALDEAIAADLARDLLVADDLTQHRRELLLDAARRLKERLSIEDEDVVVLRREEFPIGNEAWYNRTRLAAALAPQLDRAMTAVLLALRTAYLSEAPDTAPVSWPPHEQLLGGVDIVLLSGGMSRVPAVADRLRRDFPATTTVALATDPPEEAVALGLARAAPFRRNTRYALPYDIRLEWDEGRESRVLYEAYMPIIESWWLERNWSGELKFRCTGHGLGLPEDGVGVLRAGGGDMDGHPVQLNGENLELSIYPSGRIVLADGAGSHEGRAR